MTRPREGRQCVHEQLAAPSLLYRHAPSYTALDNTPPPQPWGWDGREARRYIHRTEQGIRRVRARWYHAVDHPFRRERYQLEIERTTNKKARKSIVGGDENASSAVSDEQQQRASGNEGGEEKQREGDDEESMKESDEEGDAKESSVGVRIRTSTSADEEQLAESEEENDQADDKKGRSKPKPSAIDSNGKDEEWLPVDDGEFEEGDDSDRSSVIPHKTAPLKLNDALLRDDPLLKRDFLRSRTIPYVENARQHLLANDPDSHVLRQSYQQYDHAYIPGHYRKAPAAGWRSALSQQRRRISRSMTIDRINADIAYLAPVDYESLRYCLKQDVSKTEEEKKLSLTKRRQVTYPIKADSTCSPTRYGNCLVCVPCPCDVCKGSVCGKSVAPESKNETSSTGSGASSETKRHGWCILHPTGDLLSRICVSSLLLPLGARNSALTRKLDPTRHSHRERHELDIGEAILQISPCGNGNISNTCSDPTKGLFVIRSLNYCTVVRICAHAYPERKQRSDDEPSLEEEKAPAVCPGTYRLKEVARIDLRSMCRSFRSYQPIDVANNVHFGNLYSDPKFAVLSHARNGGRNTIHHVVLRDTPVIEEHIIPSLKAISLIEFTNTHPMTLWAAAESYVRPKLVSDIYSTKPVLGHGHSLYTIDLRGNDAVFQWSPSAQEMLVEGVHSISGIMTDWQKEHSVWVSSSSAGKTWEIDGRMPCRAVKSFSLAAVCDDDRSLLPAVGLHGGGVLLTKPVVACYDRQVETSCPILSVDKSPGAFGLHLYQPPEFRPRFQTNSVECVACPGLSAHDNEPEVSVAKSSSFALPDVSESVFTCGLASFRTLTSEFLAPDVVESLGYRGETQSVLCAITMTNKGDLYSHALLECHNDDESRSKAFPGLPLGTRALAVPVGDNMPPQERKLRSLSSTSEAKLNGGWNLALSLTNEYPRSSTEIAPIAVSARKECRPFTSVRLEHLPTYPRECDASSNHDSASETASAEDTVGLPPEYSSAARAELGQLQNCFLLDRKSVIELNDTNGNCELRSDMTAAVLETASSLWKGEEDFAAHAIVNIKEEPEDSMDM